jgi:hypothetical protein
MYYKKDLTKPNFCITLITIKGGNLMGNVFDKDKQIAVIAALAEWSRAAIAKEYRDRDQQEN